MQNIWRNGGNYTQAQLTCRFTLKLCNRLADSVIGLQSLLRLRDNYGTRLGGDNVFVRTSRLHQLISLHLWKMQTQPFQS